MKKLLLLVIATFAILSANAGNVFTNAIDSVYHDGKDVVSTVYSDAKDGLSSIYPDVKSAIVSIGKAIGIAAEHVYIILVKKYFVLGIKQAAICLVGFLLFVFGLFRWNKVTKDSVISYRVVVPALLIIFGLVTLTKVDYDAMFMGLINPEYGAINYILDYTKNFIK